MSHQLFRIRAFTLVLVVGMLMLGGRLSAYFTCGYGITGDNYGCEWNGEPNGCSGIYYYCQSYCSNHGSMSFFFCDNEDGFGVCNCSQ